MLLGILCFGAWTNCNRRTVVQQPTLMIPEEFPNILIDDDSGFFTPGPCEPSIFISPANPQNVVAGAILDRVYYSEDGGKTWTKDKLQSSYGVFGDPVILADKKGHFYYAHLSNPTGGGWRDPELLDRIVIQKSTDGGKSWNNGSYAGLRHPKDQDKQWLVADPQNNNLYLTWTEFDKYNSSAPSDKSRILFCRSTDGGHSWSRAQSISQLEGNCLDDDQTTEGAVPAVGPNGEIYVAWSYNEKIYFDRSLDQGKTWLPEDVEVADQPGGWTIDIPGIYRANGMPVTCADLSKGPNRGTIYVNWSDQRNGETDTDIWLTRSTDGGNSWSAPIRVNDDEAGRHQFFNWMSVDPVTGIIYIVFYDRRAYDDNQTDVYLAFSQDGGQTFVNKKISASPFTPNDAVFFGDYNNINAYDGHVRPIWTRCDGSKLSVWTAIVDLGEE